MRLTAFAVLLASFICAPVFAQNTHLGVPVGQMVTVQFTTTATDNPGFQSGISIYTSATAPTTPTYTAIPPGKTLVITDLEIVVQSSTTSPNGSFGKLFISTAPASFLRNLAQYEAPVILNSPPTIIRAGAHLHFTAGFAFPAGTTPVLQAPVVASDVRLFGYASGYLTQ